MSSILKDTELPGVGVTTNTLRLFLDPYCLEMPSYFKRSQSTRLIAFAQSRDREPKIVFSSCYSVLFLLLVINGPHVLTSVYDGTPTQLARAVAMLKGLERSDRAPAL